MSKITEVTLALFGKQSGHNRREGDKLYQQALVSHLYPLRARQNLNIQNSFIGGGKFLGSIKTTLPIETGLYVEGYIRQVLFVVENQPLDASNLTTSASFELLHEGTVEHEITYNDDYSELVVAANMSLTHTEISFVTINSNSTDSSNLTVNATMNLLVE